MGSKQQSFPINKYGNIQTYYDTASNSIVSKETKTATTLRFDSILELEVYRILSVKFPKTSIYHHYDLEILPSILGVAKAINWCVDFAVIHNGYIFYIEAKGVETDDYKIKMNLLKRFQPLTANRLMTVFKTDLQYFAHLINTFELWSNDPTCPIMKKSDDSKKKK